MKFKSIVLVVSNVYSTSIEMEVGIKYNKQKKLFKMYHMVIAGGQKSIRNLLRIHIYVFKFMKRLLDLL